MTKRKKKRTSRKKVSNISIQKLEKDIKAAKEGESIVIGPAQVIDLDDDFTALVPPQPEISEEAKKYVESMKDKVGPASKLTFRDHLWHMKVVMREKVEGILRRMFEKPERCGWCDRKIYFYQPRYRVLNDTLHTKCYKRMKEASKIYKTVRGE